MGNTVISLAARVSGVMAGFAAGPCTAPFPAAKLGANQGRRRIRRVTLLVDVGFHQFCLSNIGAPSDVITFFELCNPAVQQGIR